MPSMLRIALSALAAASTAYAATCSISATTTIQNSGDATALASACSTFSGSIAIATGTTDDIALDGLRQLSGNLVGTENSNIKRISAADLESLDGEMQFDGLTRLYNIDFPKLKSIDSIKWNALPNLQGIGFTAEVEKAKKVDIQNTGLRNLKGINIERVETLFIANNGYITEISMQLANVTKGLTFAENNETLKVELPNLTWAANLTFRFCASVSLPSLQGCNGSLGLYNNGFESFSAPNLTAVGQALALAKNEKLSNMTFPQLTKITDNLQIANNSALLEITGLPELKSIGGAFDISGNMSRVETPKLDDVKGAFNLQSTDNITAACAFYQPLHDKKLIRGSYFCRGKVEDPGTQGHKPKDQSGNKTGAGSTLSAVNGALGLAAMAAVLLF